MKRLIYICPLILFLSMGIFGFSAAVSKTLYDDFSDININEQKWTRADTNPLEFVRKVSVNDGKLISKVGNSTDIGLVRNHTPFSDPASIHTIQSDISVQSAVLDSGPNASSLARIQGIFYNTQTSGGATGDILATITIGNRGAGLEAWWLVIEFSNDSLSSYTSKGEGTLAVPGLAYDQTYTARLEYDGDKSFTFSVAGVSASFETGPDKQRGPVFQHKTLTTQVVGASGTGFVSATFDNVYINNQETVYDDFSSAPLDQVKWQALEFERAVENNRLHLATHSEGATSTARLKFTQSLPCLEATFTVKDESWISSGTNGRIRLRGHMYNDTYGPGSGQLYEGLKGDVYAFVAIYLYDDGILGARYYAEREDDANGGSWTTLIDEGFSMSIVKGRAYTLSMRLADSKLIFACKDSVTLAEEIAEYQILTNIYIPYDFFFKQIEARVNSGSRGCMAVEVDDVYTEDAAYDATGEWVITMTEAWSDCEDPEPGQTLDVIITQTGSDVVLVVHGDEEDSVFNGTVFGRTYSFKRYETEEAGIFNYDLVFNISDNYTARGLHKSYEYEEDQECNGMFYFTIAMNPRDPRPRFMTWLPILLE